MESKSCSVSSRTRFGRLLSGVVNEDCAKGTYDDDYCSSSRVPECDTLSVVAQCAHEADRRDYDIAVRMESQYASEAKHSEEEDEKYALRLEGEFKDENFAQDLDRVLSMESARDHARDKLARRKMDRADSKVAADMYDAEEKYLRESKEAGIQDEGIARRMQRNMDRQRHQERKAKEADDDFDKIPVAERWARVSELIELEDVSGAICVSCRLPGLAHVTVKPYERRFIKVEAKTKQSVLADRNNKYPDDDDKKKARLASMKLEMVSSGCCITQSDLHYEYDSASGYLHIYIDNLKLGSMDKPQRLKAISELRRAASAKCKTFISLIIDSHTK